MLIVRLYIVLIQFPTVTICNRNLYKQSMTVGSTKLTERQKALYVDIMKDLYFPDPTNPYTSDKYEKLPAGTS